MTKQKAKFRVFAKLEMASKPTDGNVVIDGASNTLTVRPLHSRREYTMSLDNIAEYVVRTIIAAETLK